MRRRAQSTLWPASTNACAQAYALVQVLLGAKRDPDLPRALRKPDLFDAIPLDDLGYVQQSPRRA